MKGRAWAEINVSSVKHNFNVIKNRLSTKTKICCSIKSNGYGHGAKRLAKEFENLGADYFAVSNFLEAIELRCNNIKTPIIILGYTPAYLAKRLVKYNLTQTIYSYDYALALLKELERENLILKAHLKLDTGMGRIGFRCLGENLNELDIACKVCKLKNFSFEGVFTHFSVADEIKSGKDFTIKQFNNFLYGVKYLEDRGVKFKIKHASNSAGVFNYLSFNLDMVRVGISLYGVGSSELKEVMTLKTVISHIKKVEKGDSISYGRDFIAKKDTIVATLPIGYADGVLRKNAKTLKVMVNGSQAPVVGRICMDQLMIDVSQINVKIGDEVIIFGKGGVSIEEFAQNNKTIPYEILTNISQRVERVYIK